MAFEGPYIALENDLALELLQIRFVNVGRDIFFVKGIKKGLNVGFVAFLEKLTVNHDLHGLKRFGASGPHLIKC
jgi:hypothetical protein